MSRKFYAVCPCTLCGKPMDFAELRLGVYWAEKLVFGSWWERFWMGECSEVADTVFAHAKCWAALSERKRQLVRAISDEQFPPRIKESLA